MTEVELRQVIREEVRQLLREAEDGVSDFMDVYNTSLEDIDERIDREWEGRGE